MASLIERMPSELLYKICEYLDEESPSVRNLLPDNSKDISSFRSTCKTFAVIGLKELMRTINFVTAPKSFLNLRTIANNPKLAPKVRTIEWEVHRLRHFSSVDEWKTYVKNGHRVQGYVGNSEEVEASRDRLYDFFALPDCVIQYAWNQYGRIRLFQQVFLHKIPLELLLSGFTNLESFHFLTEGMERDCNWHGPSCHNHYRQTLLQPNRSDFSVDYGAAEMYSLVNAAAITRKPLKEIQHDHLAYTFFQLYRNDESLSRPHALADSLGNLSTLHLVICLDDGLLYVPGEGDLTDVDRSDGAKAVKAGLLRFLQELPRLNDLALQFRHKDNIYYFDEDDDDFDFDLEVPPAGLHLNDVLGSIRWPSLRMLNLSWIRFESKSLVDFLENHASTLDSVCLSKMHLLDDSWATMFDSIHALGIGEVRLLDWFSSNVAKEFFFMDATITKKKGVLFATHGLAFGLVQLYTSHPVSRLLTGKEYEGDDEITACVDYWMRGDGSKRLQPYWSSLEDGDWVEQDDEGHFTIDNRNQGANQGRGSNLCFGRFIANSRWQHWRDFLPDDIVQFISQY